MGVALKSIKMPRVGAPPAARLTETQAASSSAVAFARPLSCNFNGPAMFGTAAPRRRGAGPGAVRVDGDMV